jgi:hypothetical protein
MSGATSRRKGVRYESSWIVLVSSTDVFRGQCSKQHKAALVEAWAANPEQLKLGMED